MQLKLHQLVQFTNIFLPSSSAQQSSPHRTAASTNGANGNHSGTPTPDGHSVRLIAPPNGIATTTLNGTAHQPTDMQMSPPAEPPQSNQTGSPARLKAESQHVPVSVPLSSYHIPMNGYATLPNGTIMQVPRPPNGFMQQCLLTESYLPVSFDRVAFTRVSLDRVSFDPVIFDRVIFTQVSFDRVIFDRVVFTQVSLDRVSLDRVSLDRVSFDQVLFDRVVFTQVSLDRVSLDRVSFDQVLFDQVVFTQVSFDRVIFN
ncbi:uncharacterized protein EDB91DRAFT_1314081 [Suillus paluster]|uniref:uncharacterized protein n=1 Tax=Suillus paluster TaxID=48578 RepID=UPI001B870A79|nr:uncharacterized protein EDB91DRAFT_1314081 [Suillus paluster]KAG1728245.1 hypothetical protein EDB91DRAFT_1314081 [Suillus paluster]